MMKFRCFSYDDDEHSAYINILRIAKGSVVQGFTIEYQKKWTSLAKNC